jgi:hypothetical protein
VDSARREAVSSVGAWALIVMIGTVSLVWRRTMFASGSCGRTLTSDASGGGPPGSVVDDSSVIMRSEATPAPRAISSRSGRVTSRLASSWARADSDATSTLTSPSPPPRSTACELWESIRTAPDATPTLYWRLSSFGGMPSETL